MFYTQCNGHMFYINQGPLRDFPWESIILGPLYFYAVLRCFLFTPLYTVILYTWDLYLLMIYIYLSIILKAIQEITYIE